MEEVVKEETFININDNYRITSDTRLNLILQEKYFKRAGRGKGAELTDEEAFKDVGYFGASLQALIRRFNHDEFLETFSEVEKGQGIVEALEEMRTYLEEREKRIYEHVNKHVSLELKNTKGVTDE